MASQPGTRKYLFVSVSQAPGPGMKTAATIDLAAGKSAPFNPKYQHFCSGATVLADGQSLIVGGNAGNGVLLNGLRIISTFNPATNNMSFTLEMHYNRWYPTVIRLQDGKVLIVGGIQGSGFGPPAPFAELFDPADPTHLDIVQQPPVFQKAARNNLYPFISLMPYGEILWWGDTAGSITDSAFNVLQDLPPLPPSFPYQTMFRATATITAHAFRPDANGAYNKYSFSIFGGGVFFNVLQSTTVASRLSVSMDMWYCDAPGGICNSGWTVEEMPGPRVMADSTVLPNGRIYIHGGAQAGLAGQKTENSYNGIDPATFSFTYDPLQPVNMRYTTTDYIGVARMYHSTVCLDVTGVLFSAGCTACGVELEAGIANLIPNNPADGERELRMTIATPTEIGAGVVRPVISAAPSVIQRGGEFDVSYSYSGTISAATIAAPCAVTHSINMNQRVIFLVVVSDDAANGVIRLRAPPSWQPAVAPSGWYMLFLNGDATPNGNTYSQGVWLQLQ